VHVRLSLPADPDAPIRARHEISRCPAVPAHCRQDLALLVSEVVTNAVRHARGQDHDRPIEVDAHCGEEEVRVVVRDGGRGVARPRTPGLDGGYGLHIVDAIASAWGAAPGELWFVLRTAGAGA
jgi:two-component sensor histidine kinase